MNVLLISQCSKKALEESRRILDQFAERKGDRTWQTAITQQGLATLRKMLRKSAKRNTAVACHWIKSGNEAELLWIVGSIKAFNEHGTVPTHSTRRDILRTQDENHWHTVEAIALMASIAGLFHDFGKANKLFQKKLDPASGLRSEPLRHEWLSLRLFQAFVNGEADKQWLARLAQVGLEEDAATLARVVALQDSAEKSANPKSANPFGARPGCLTGDLAKAIGWLIVSHHRLPQFNESEKKGWEPRLDEIDQWMGSNGFGASWNSVQAEWETWDKKAWQQVWEFRHGTPFRSQHWRSKAHSLARRALKHSALFARNWLHDAFSSHLARLTLMLSDHCYSAGAATPAWQDPSYAAWANTERSTRALKQKLDEHNIGVGHNAFLLAKNLPRLRESLPAITRHKGFKQRSRDARFRWQDKAFELAQGLAVRSAAQGFFGVNMASTGCGKTFANARIMYGLADEKRGCRFSVALGLRTLTLQTGDALQARLHLESDDLAVLIGSQAVRQLHAMQQQKTPQASVEQLAAQSGSESAQDLFDEFQYLRYDGTLDDGRLSKWLKLSPKLHQLLSAPVLVSTIDHLMPATEGARGGKQIAPMLRLLTSDLVLDEPDDFDLADLPALCRLVNWAGMLGARVLLSSATLPPALIHGLYDAYASGRKVFQAACGTLGALPVICCAWFDEFDAKHSEQADLGGFAQAHEQFVRKRIHHLREQNQVLRKAALIKVETVSRTDVVAGVADVVREGMMRLHTAHHQIHPASGKRVSIGLVRMANINPMVAVAQRVLGQEPPANCRLHFCVYHGQHPLLVRSEMEKALDAALTRHQADAIWQVPAIQLALAQYPEQEQIFIVFATSVAEVGRDHDYDWAIAEPSSMRSLIQLAGRIQRHRQQCPNSANMLILNKNVRALQGQVVAYTKPGFESSKFNLADKDLRQSLLLEQYQTISATPRILPRENPDSSTNLVDLEHAHLAEKLFGAKKLIPAYAALWWRHQTHWCAEMQRRTPFRLSAKDEEFVLYLEDETDQPTFCRVAESGELAASERCFVRVELPQIARVQAWVANDVKALLEQIAEREQMELAHASRRFASLRLRELGEQAQWCYHPLMGVYGALE